MVSHCDFFVSVRLEGTTPCQVSSWDTEGTQLACGYLAAEPGKGAHWPRDPTLLLPPKERAWHRPHQVVGKKETPGLSLPPPSLSSSQGPHQRPCTCKELQLCSNATFQGGRLCQYQASPPQRALQSDGESCI